MKPHTITLLEPAGVEYRDVVYQISMRHMKAHLGLTNYTRKTITINPRQDEEDILSTAWHEAVHVAVPMLMENAVLAVEYNIRQMDQIVREALGLTE